MEVIKRNADAVAGCQDANTAGGCGAKALVFAFVAGLFGDALGFFFFVAPPPFALGVLLLVPLAEAPAPPLVLPPAAGFFFLEPEAPEVDVGTVIWPVGPIFMRNVLGWSSGIVIGGATL